MKNSSQTRGLRGEREVAAENRTSSPAELRICLSCAQELLWTGWELPFGARCACSWVRA